MRMIPPVVGSATQSNAERKVFGLLEETDLGPYAVAYHSLNLAEHDYKVSGEIDFLIVTPASILVLEVKGGGIAFREGIWRYTDRYGKEHRSSEGPFRQAESAMHSLRRRLVDRFSEQEVRGLRFGFAVVFPDDDFSVESPEWSQRVVLDARRLRRKESLERELAEINEYWAEKVGRRRDVEIPFLDRIKRFLRPDFDLVPSLAHRADQLDVAMERLTEEQYHQLDLIEDTPRIICEGGAGTGKTFLALETAKRHAASGKSVLLVCRSPILAAFLAGRVDSPLIRVTDWESLDAEEPYDVLIVDEGQDLLNLEAVARFDDVVAGGLEEGTWRFFLDANNQAAIHSVMDPEALALLNSAGAVPGKLRRNCRNTHEVVLQTKLMTAADLGNPSAGHGPPVEFAYYDSAAEQAQLLDGYLRRVFDGGEDASDITIISPLPFGESAAGLLPAKRRDHITVVDGRVASRWPPSGVTFASVEDFKGLENRFVALVDVEDVESDDTAVASLYVAMSRARVGLWIALPRRLESIVAAVAERNLEAVLNDARVS